VIVLEQRDRVLPRIPAGLFPHRRHRAPSHRLVW
jgi:hypothetical protein